MQINWFTFVIQIINFLILVILLKHFLYKQIVSTMNEREALIASRLGAAEQKEQEANRQIESYHQKLKELDEEHIGMLAQIKEDVEAQRKTSMQQALAEVDQIRSDWRKNIQQEKKLFLQDFRKHTAHQICVMARRALADLANVELEQQVINIFIERFRLLNEAERAAIAATIRQSESEIKIYSSFELCPEMRQRIINVMQEQLGDEIIPQFETAPDLVFGLELHTSGCKIAWALADYLDSFEEKLAEALEVEAKNDNL